VISLEAANSSINTGSLFSRSSSISGNAGNGGAISLSANGSIDSGYLSSHSSSFSGSAGQGGNISIEAANGRITRFVGIDASGASGGNITLTSPAGLFELEEGSINSNASNGNAGNILLNAASVSLTNTELTTTARGAGNAGNISITADGLVQLDKSRLFTSLELGGIGKGGDITIEAGAVSLSSASFIDTATFGQGNAGNVSLKVDDSVLLDNNSAIFSITSGQGNGGNVRVEAGGAVWLANRSNISTAVNLGAVGDGGNIDIVARSLSLSGGSQLVTSTSSSGKAGNITVNTTEGVIISGVDPNFTPPQNVSVGNPPPLAEVEPNDSIAQAQRLTQFFHNSPNDVNPNVELSSRIPYVSISGQTSGQGYPQPYVSSEDYYSFEITAAGTRAIFDIDIPQLGGAYYTSLTLFDHAGNRLSNNFLGSPSQGAGGSTRPAEPYGKYVFSEPGTYFIQVKSASTGAYTLNVSLDTPNVATSVVNGTLPSGLFARTQGAGAAGNVTINTPQLTVFDGGNVSATATATATSSQQGSIKVNASQVNLSGNNSGLFALTEGAAPAGSLTLQPYNNGQSLTVNLQQGAQISASTNGSGQGGTLTVTAPESITLTGNGSIISAETSGSGTGGDLTLKTGTLTVRDEAKVTVSSTRTGDAGNLNITANTVLLDNGQLIAKTASGEGGNIYLKVDDLLLMRNHSLISAEAGNNGNGGNIDIDARLIVAVPKEDSDIVADADRGNGGNINITTQGIFGLKYRQERTPESDITASSRFGIAGTVNINQLTIDPSQGLTNLPTEVVDASNQIDQTCSAGRGEVGKNQFTITGRGGMPTSPYEMLGEEEALPDVHPPAGFSSSRNSQPVAQRAVTPQGATSNQKPPIVEATGWVINDKGQVVLTATPTTVTPHDSWLPQASCPRS
jgi:large exoprotein involved in heme utilization and adhesion